MIVSASYLSGFIDSVCYAFERDEIPYDRNQISQVISLEATASKLSELAAFRKLASHYVESCAQRGAVAHACHAISDAFMMTLSNITQIPLPLAITIGDVWVKGKKKYGVNRSGIDQLIRTGFDQSKFVDAHVWLTLSDMTVIDLTILSTLHAEGALDGVNGLGDGILVWREDEPSDYVFEPLLVDNAFFSKVERGNYQFA